MLDVLEKGLTASHTLKFNVCIETILLRSRKHLLPFRGHPMRIRSHLLGLIALAAAATGAGSAARTEELPPCKPESAIGTACMCPLSTLHPMQAAVGMLEVEKRVAKIKAMSEGQLRKYEQCRPVPLIVGPGTSDAAHFYLTDHHHLARALLDAGQNSAQCIVQESHAELPEPDFWNL